MSIATGLVSGFFAYPGSPGAISDAVKSAVHQLEDSRTASIVPWEDLSIGGRFVIDVILKKIDESALLCADLTDINPNVLFELGYGIARKKRIWLLLNTSKPESIKTFRELKTLTVIGYAGYRNSIDIYGAFVKDKPHTSLEKTAYADLIEPNLACATGPSLLYMKSRVNSEASIEVSKRVENSKLKIIVDDPTELSSQTITWYGTQVATANAVLCHSVSPDMEGAQVHNARCALVAGMAAGFGKNLLLLAEGDYFAPLDYRHLLQQYERASQAFKIVDSWLSQIEVDSLESFRGPGATTRETAAVALPVPTTAKDLKALRVGEFLAENEVQELVDDYFVETVAYREALEGKHRIFVGRKGAGKSANFFKLADTLRKDRRNLVCVIKPVGYEVQGIVELLKQYNSAGQESYLLETLWKFLLLSEIAKDAAQIIEERPNYVNTTEAERELLELLDQPWSQLREDFSTRLERSVESLLKLQSLGSLEESRKSITQTLHEGLLARLRIVLGDVLSSRTKVAILIDNLDKAWDRQADLNGLAKVFLGLLNAVEDLSIDFKKGTGKRHSINLSLAVFLREDILSKIREVAPEPDKIVFTRLTWSSPDLLRRVVEERILSSSKVVQHGYQVWQKLFCATVGGVSTKDFFVAEILPRPRDIVYFVKASIENAINRGHSTVTERDVLDAKLDYSGHAIDSLMAEDVLIGGKLGDLFYEVMGSNSVLTREEIHQAINKAGISLEPTQVVDYLCKLGFFGFEVSQDDYAFVDDPRDFKRLRALSDKYASSNSQSPRFKINSPFHAFLGVEAN
jgi:hypothetical protein